MNKIESKSNNYRILILLVAMMCYLPINAQTNNGTTSNDDTQKVEQSNPKLKKGSPSPKFVDLYNYNGGTSSLDDFKGKYVYIDVWATWCGPCLQEIPHLMELEKKYEGRNIVFVSISGDKSRKFRKWEKTVKKLKMGGVQLCTKSGSDNDFIKAYGINSIPRFILVDPQGNIVNADATRPSSTEIIDLFDELGI